MSSSAIFTSPGASSGTIYSAASAGAAEKGCPAARCSAASLALLGASLLLGTVSVLAFMQVLPFAVATLAVLKWGAGGGALVCGALSLCSTVQGGSRGKGASLPADRKDAACKQPEQTAQKGSETELVEHAGSEGTARSEAEPLQRNESVGSSAEAVSGSTDPVEHDKTTPRKNAGSSVDSIASVNIPEIAEPSEEENLFDRWWASQQDAADAEEGAAVISSSPSSYSDEEARFRGAFVSWMHAQNRMVRLSVTGLLDHLFAGSSSFQSGGALIREIADPKYAGICPDENKVREACADIVRGLNKKTSIEMGSERLIPMDSKSGSDSEQSPDLMTPEKFREDIWGSVHASEGGFPHTRMQDRDRLTDLAERILSSRNEASDGERGALQDEMGAVEAALERAEPEDTSEGSTNPRFQPSGSVEGENGFTGAIVGEVTDDVLEDCLEIRFQNTAQILQEVVISVARQWMEAGSGEESQPVRDRTSVSDASEVSEISAASSRGTPSSECRESLSDAMGLDHASFVFPRGTRKELSSPGSNVWWPEPPSSSDWKIDQVDRIIWPNEAISLYSELQNSNDETKSLDIERFIKWFGQQSDGMRAAVTGCFGTLFSEDRPEEWVIVGLVLIRSMQTAVHARGLRLDEGKLQQTCEHLGALPNGTTTDNLIDSLQSLWPDDEQLSKLISRQRAAGTRAQILAQYVVQSAVEHCFSRVS